MESSKELRVVLSYSPTSWADLPTVLKSDILVRLPVETLVISTAVCKSWYTHIKTPTFISTHINRSTPITQSLLLAHISSNTLTLITNNHKLHPPFTPPSESVIISGWSCDGLLLLVGTDFVNRDLFLSNPSLNKHKHLPISSSSLANLSNIHYTYPIVGFGFSKTHNDYRIVRILYSVSTDSTRSFDVKVAPEVEVYSLNKDCWRKVDVRVTRMGNYHHWVCIDGVIYWLERKGDFEYKWLVWFDLNEDKFGEMELPKKFRDGVAQNAQAIVCEYKGLLGFCVFAEICDGVFYTMPLSLWVRKGDWVNELRVVLKDMIGRPLKFTKCGDLILEARYFRHGGPIWRQLSAKFKVVSYDLEKLTYKDIESHGPYSVDTSYVESLLLFEEQKPRFKASLLQ